MTTHFGKIYHGFRLVRQSLLSYQLDTATVLRYKQQQRRLYDVKGGGGGGRSAEEYVAGGVQQTGGAFYPSSYNRLYKYNQGLISPP